MAKELRLSQSSVEMLESTMETMKSYGFTSFNIPSLLYGIMNSEENDEDYSALANYLYSMEVSPADVEDALLILLVDYSAKLHKEYDDAEKAKNSSKKPEDSKTSESTTATITTDVIPDGAASATAVIEEIIIDADSPLKDDFQADISFTNPDGKKADFPANKDVVNVYERLIQVVENYSIEEIDPLHFTIAMFMTESTDIKRFFRDIYNSYVDAKKYFKAEHVLKMGCIPFSLTGFISTLNEKVDPSKPCPILKRDKEVETLWNILLKMKKRNAVLVGEAGVGKTALAEKITYDIASGNCPKEFKNFKVLSLDVNSLIAGTTFRGEAEERIKNIVEFLQKTNDVILFIDEVHTILGAGSCFEGEMDFANAMKPILARGETFVIGATTENEYKKYFQKDAALSRRFEMVTVKEPKTKDVYPMIKNQIQILSEFHKVKISKEMAEYAIMIAGCFGFNKHNPDKSLDLLDRAMATAKRKNNKYVTTNCILKNFGIFFKMWNNMSEDSKMEVTYHELGHYIVGKGSEKLIEYEFVAISIMPAENYLGITVSDDNNEVVPFTNLDYYIDEIAFYLGGSVAESIFRNDLTSGARADLEIANQLAYDVVTKLGLCSAEFANRSYLNTECYPMISEKISNKIDVEVKKLVDKAHVRAQELINKNFDILEALVPALLKNRIMSEAELDKIWQETVRKRKN